jgi:hypothetical protein
MGKSLKKYGQDKKLITRSSEYSGVPHMFISQVKTGQNSIQNQRSASFLVLRKG